MAIACIFFGWFFIDTLVVNLGSWRHGIRFFDLSAVIADPSRMFFAIHWSAQRVFFGLLCMLCLAAPLLPHWRRDRGFWLAYFAPLGLMLLCGAMLYSRTSREFLNVASDSAAAVNIIRLANDVFHRGSGLVARHIAVGIGGYLALIASLVLALRGARRFRLRAGGS